MGGRLGTGGFRSGETDHALINELTGQRVSQPANQLLANDWRLLGSQAESSFLRTTAAWVSKTLKEAANKKE